jgi:hypothetical protein
LQLEVKMGWAEAIGLGSIAGPVFATLGQGASDLLFKGIDQAIFGRPGEQLKETMDDAYPGTTSIERLSGGGGGSSQAMSVPTARHALNTQKDVARINAAAQKYSADKQLEIAKLNKLPLGDWAETGEKYTKQIIDLFNAELDSYEADKTAIESGDRLMQTLTEKYPYVPQGVISLYYDYKMANPDSDILFPEWLKSSGYEDKLKKTKWFIKSTPIKANRKK